MCTFRKVQGRLEPSGCGGSSHGDNSCACRQWPSVHLESPDTHHQPAPSAVIAVGLLPLTGRDHSSTCLQPPGSC